MVLRALHLTANAAAHAAASTASARSAAVATGAAQPTASATGTAVAPLTSLSTAAAVSASPATLAAAATQPAAAATQPAAAAAAAQPTAAAAAAAAAAAPAAAQGASGCNRDHSKLLSQDDVLCRVPRGALAFVSLANGAYAELGINWALLLVPVLAKVGHGDRAFLFALDDDGAERFLAKKLPTVKQYTSARHGPRDNDGFRWAPGAFRKYGVTKAEVILWLLKAGRDVCMSDVDAAWIAPPCAARLAARNSWCARKSSERPPARPRAQVRAVRVGPRGRRAVGHRLPPRAVGQGPLDARAADEELRPPAGVEVVGVVQHRGDALPRAAEDDGDDV